MVLCISVLKVEQHEITAIFLQEQIAQNPISKSRCNSGSRKLTSKQICESWIDHELS